MAQAFKKKITFLNLSDLLSDKLAGPNPNLPSTMKSTTKVDRASLEKREVEVQNLIRQMKMDHLHQSPVYKNLEQELSELKSKLIRHAEQ